MVARGFSVLIISGSNLKLIFLSQFFVIVFYTGLVVLGQAEILSESVVFSLRRADSGYLGKKYKTWANTGRFLSWNSLSSG